MESLAKVINYDATTREEATKNNASMRKIIQNDSKTMKNLDQNYQEALQQLNNLQEECLAIQIKCENLQNSLDAANKRFTIDQHLQEICA